MKELLQIITLFFLLLTTFPSHAELTEQTGADADEPATVTIYATRSSPFNPPTKDVFVTDTGPGLDTGCTFNTDSNHPLIIDIDIDRSVGAVDANGYLTAPQPLIAAGIIPAKVQITLPAYDIDINGTPPPEHDELLFNGEKLGLLSGDNRIWKLNSFTVDIQKLKFPPPPASGSSPGVAKNRVQINIDLLNNRRWCAAVDWVAIALPIRPKIALTLTPKAGNKIRQNTGSSSIDTIYEQKVDSACKITEAIGPIDDYPFSGSASAGSMKLHTKIEPCPKGSLDSPEVIAEWKIAGTTLKGISKWTGLEGDVSLNLPDKIGAYQVTVNYKVDTDTKSSVTRKLFVTKNPPLAAVKPPRRMWYEKAVSWASGEKDETKIQRKLLGGEYAYGQGNWKYAYNFGPATKCNWQQLVADPLSCNYSDCYVFSDVFENMLATLGVGGLASSTPTGAHSKGFVTTGSPSIDPAFPGNTRPLASTGAYDRYLFSSHSLRSKGGNFYDATFNGIYGTSTEFIAYNFTGAAAGDTHGTYLITDEGAKVYPKTGDVYDSWGKSEYTVPPPPGPQAGKIFVAINIAAVGMNFTGNASFSSLDMDSDGLSEALSADIELSIVDAGEYVIYGLLQKNGVTISNAPGIDSMLFSHAKINAAAGTYQVNLQFSGEHIYQANADGPYDLLLFGIGSTDSTSTILTSPAFRHTDFGEIPVVVNAVSDQALDLDSDGDKDVIEAVLDVTVRAAGTFRLQGNLQLGVDDSVNGDGEFTLSTGNHSLPITFAGQKVRRAGVDDAYTGVVSLIDSSGHTFNSTTFTTTSYMANSFDALLLADGRFSDLLIDTDGNGLSEYLEVEFGADIARAGNYLLTGILNKPGMNTSVFTDQIVTLAADNQLLKLNFSGPLINFQGLDGPYEITVVIRDAKSFDELDRLTLDTHTNAYTISIFESLLGPKPLIELTGNIVDQGLDTNSNNQFDVLVVDLEVELAQQDRYEWSARLVDSNGTEIGFDNRSANFDAGVNNLHFEFDGKRIGENNIDGPYFLNSLLVYGRRGSSLVVLNADQTSAYSVYQFEGANRQPIADGGGDRMEECQGVDGAIVMLDGSASSDPDGDPLSYTWTGSFGTLTGVQASILLPLGSHVITLTVDDGKGASDVDSFTVDVLDTTPPAVMAALNPIGELDDDEGDFEVTFSCEDVCDAGPVLSAELNGLSVVNGQRIELELDDDETEAEYDNGLLSELEATSFELIVNCTDAAGNVGSILIVPVFASDDDDDDSDDNDDEDD